MKKETVAQATAVSLMLAVSVIFVLAIASLANAQQVKPSVEARCHDTGSFSVVNLDDRGISVSVKKSGSSSVPASGSWREMADGLYKFTSDEMAVVDVKGGYYTITVDKKSYGVTCPPFEFSCNLINISINSCYKRNSTFFGKYTAYSFRYDKKNEFRFEKPFMLTYETIANVGGKKKELTHAPNAVSPDFETINITRIKRVGSNTYTLKWQTPLNVSKFMVRYDDCETVKHKFYDSFECTDRPSCSTDKQCLASERCDGGFCIPVSCAACQYQTNHTCIDYDCCTDLDCDSGFICGGNSCQKLACEFDEYVVGHGCEKLECAEDEYIFNSSCSKLNCAKGQIVVNNICKDIICNDDESIDTETN
ncbi:MAG: hypothetical protein AABX69_03050, partial [Nanoarchaeota archaeon]